MSFIRKRNRTYHLQVKVPKELTDILGRYDLSISLGTGSKRKAGKLAELANVRYQLAFRELRLRAASQSNKKDMKSMVDIKKLVREYVKDDLADFELMQATGRAGNSDTLDDELEALDVDLDHSREALMESIIEELLGRAGKTETSRRYAKGYRVETLYREAVLKLDFEIS